MSQGVATAVTHTGVNDSQTHVVTMTVPHGHASRQPTKGHPSRFPDLRERSKKIKNKCVTGGHSRRHNRCPRRVTDFGRFQVSQRRHLHALNRREVNHGQDESSSGVVGQQPRPESKCMSCTLHLSARVLTFIAFVLTLDVRPRSFISQDNELTQTCRRYTREYHHLCCLHP